MVSYGTILGIFIFDIQYIRRLKDDVLTELPKKRRVKIPVQISSSHTKIIRKISQKIKESKKEIMAGLNQGDNVRAFNFII